MKEYLSILIELDLQWRLFKMKEKTDKKKVKKDIEEYEYYQNGYNKLNGHYVEARNIRIKKDIIVADIIINDQLGGKTERYNNTEYKKEVLKLTKSKNI